MLIKEIFKQLGSSSYYASNFGRVISTSRVVTGKLLKATRSTHGYLYHNLKPNKKKFVHRLVMEAFHGPSKLDVNHKDGNKENNNLENLEYVTKSQNLKHAHKTGLKVATVMRGSSNGRAKLTEADALKIKNSLQGTGKLAARYAVSVQTIINIRKGKSWKHLK